MKHIHPRSRLAKRNRRGTNQYRVKQRGNWKYWLLIYAVALILLMAFAKYYQNFGEVRAYSRTPILSPIPANFREPIVQPIEPEGPSEKEQIVAYITRLWEKHGTDQVVRAINCFYSESGLRANAYGENTNGTNDAGVAQVNSIHGLSVEERMDWKTNLDKAYQIWIGRGAEASGWEAWYGKACN